MEFTIDFVSVRRIIAQEYREAREEITTLGPLAAYEQSQRRHDERIAAAPDVSTLACKNGCSWCCHFTIDVRPVEVFRILDFVERHLSAADQERVRSEVTTNRATIQPLSDIERMQHNVRCPFLVAGRCTIYAARPQTCRNYHATDAAGCQKSFEEPDNLDIDPEFAPLVYQYGGAHVEAFSRAMQDAGYDVAAYEMNTALATAMEQLAAARKRFETKEQTFPELAGEEVPPEFMDDAEREGL
ncbi:MAG TPA: YkgJ family cysteine cluster protein [Povalibacter sp.]|nr:YkgJ family cysteine cluster protein [Povalibacter sp.]